MCLALRLAKRGLGATSPNPMVGAVLARGGKIIGQGFHRRAGGPHAEIEAFKDAARRGFPARGATLYVTLEPCCTHGRTPPCTEAIIAAGVKRVVVGATDPNPKHRGKGFSVLKRAGVCVELMSQGDGAAKKLSSECEQLNESFNHWIVNRTPLVTVKAAMTLDGKIATASGESKWITGVGARAEGMKLRAAADAILVGVNTVLADDPSLTVGGSARGEVRGEKIIRRVILDSQARTPLTAKVVADEFAASTTIVVGEGAPKKRVEALSKRVNVLVAPTDESGINLRWLLMRLGKENVTSLLVEGGGEVNASFLFGGFAQRVAFFYAPKILGGRDSRKAVAGNGAANLSEALRLEESSWQKIGADLLLRASVAWPNK